MSSVTMNISDVPSNIPNPNLFRNATSINIWAGSVMYTVIYSINLVIGFPLNSYVLWLILMGKGSGVVSEFFNLNLTLCEILICFSDVSYLISYIFPTLLTLSSFLWGMPICGRSLFLCLICVERYMAVVHPVTFLKYKPLRYRLMCSAVVWMVILGFCVLFMCIASSRNMYLLICIVLPLYLLFFIVKLSCSLAVVRALKHPGPGQKEKERDEANQVKRKAVTVILIITVATFFQYCPVILVALLYSVLTWTQFEIFWCIGISLSLFVGYVHAVLFIHRTGCFSPF